MDCKQYHNDYYSFIENDFQAIAPEHLEHLRTCPTCRRQIEQLQQALAAPTEPQTPFLHEYLALHFQLLNRAVDCTAVKPFLPCLAAATLPIHCPTPVTAHLEACSACRADYKKLLALQLTDEQLLQASRCLAAGDVSQIALSERAERILSVIQQRPGSGVLTVAELSEQDDAETLQVRTLHPSKTPSKRHRWRTFRAAAGLAAAIVLLAVMLFVGAPRVEALNIHHLYGALADAKNLSIRTIVPEENDPIQQLWISQGQGLRLFESPEKTVLYDLNATTITVRDNVSLMIQVKPFDSTASSDNLQLPWGLLPFRDVTQIPEGIHWKRLNAQTDDRLVVYEMAWRETSVGRQAIEKRWVGYLDQTTHLPERVEWYERFGDQASYRLMMAMVIAYPQTETVLEAIRNSGL